MLHKFFFPLFWQSQQPIKKAFHIISSGFPNNKMDLSENVEIFVRICLQRATLSKLDREMPARKEFSGNCNKNSCSLFPAILLVLVNNWQQISSSRGGNFYRSRSIHFLSLSIPSDTMLSKMTLVYEYRRKNLGEAIKS